MKEKIETSVAHQVLCCQELPPSNIKTKSATAESEDSLQPMKTKERKNKSSLVLKYVCNSKYNLLISKEPLCRVAKDANLMVNAGLMMTNSK